MKNRDQIMATILMIIMLAGVVLIIYSIGSLVMTAVQIHSKPADKVLHCHQSQNDPKSRLDCEWE
jgi:hypothetical protein